MSDLQYRIALAFIYTALAAVILACALYIASITVLPMYENWRGHGSVFLANPGAAPCSFEGDL